MTHILRKIKDSNCEQVSLGSLVMDDLDDNELGWMKLYYD